MERVRGPVSGGATTMTRGQRAWHGRWRAPLLLVTLLSASLYGTTLLSGVEGVLLPLYAKWGAPAFAVALAALVGLLAVPFLPGVELGWALMLIVGPGGILLVYGAALVALSLSFAAGRRIPLSAGTRFLHWLRIHRGAEWVASLMPQAPQEQLSRLVHAAPARWAPFLLHHRYLALAVLLNLPGNTLLGGGGGIALLAGLSGLFTYPRFLFTVALATAPLPLVMLANIQLARWLWG